LGRVYPAALLPGRVGQKLHDATDGRRSRLVVGLCRITRSHESLRCPRAKTSRVAAVGTPRRIRRGSERSPMAYRSTKGRCDTRSMNRLRLERSRSSNVARAWQLGVQLPLHAALVLSDFPASS